MGRPVCSDSPILRSAAELPYATVYITLTSLLPLAISFTTLLLFRPLYKVAWGFALVFGIVALAACSLAKGLIDPSRLQVVGGGELSPAVLDTFLYVSICIIACCAISYLAWRAYHIWFELKTLQRKVGVVAHGPKAKSSLGYRLVKKGDEADPAAKRKAHHLLVARNVLIILVLLLISQLDAIQPTIFNLGPFFSGVFIFLAVYTAGYTALSLTSSGRNVLQYAGNLVDRTAVSFFLALLGFLYVPITRMLFSVWLWREQTCPRGSWYPLFANELTADSAAWLNTGTVTCETCQFLSGGQSACVADFCPGSTSRRAFEDPRLSWDELILPFFGYGAVAARAGRATGASCARCPPSPRWGFQDGEHHYDLGLHPGGALPLLQNHLGAHHHVRKRPRGAPQPHRGGAASSGARQRGV